MHIIVAPSTRTVRTETLDLLEENIQNHIGSSPVSVDISRVEDNLLVDVADGSVVDLCIALSRVPGVESAGIAEEGDVTADVDELESLFADVAQSEAFFLNTDNSADWAAGIEQDETGVEVSVLLDGQTVYAYRDPVKGIGGRPIDPDNDALVLMTDRAATVAAAEAMLDGYLVHPIYTGQEADTLQEDMRTLQTLDPRIKLTVYKGKDSNTALDEAAKLFGTHTAVFPDTADDDPRDASGDFETIFPNTDRSNQDVLDRYSELLYPEF